MGGDSAGAPEAHKPAGVDTKAAKLARLGREREETEEGILRSGYLQHFVRADDELVVHGHDLCLKLRRWQ